MHYPENSLAPHAQNPQMYKLWTNILDHEQWPYAVLCYDLHEQNLTWHVLCNEQPFADYLTSGLYKPTVDTMISAMRKRPLISIELFCADNSHYFLEHDLNLEEIS